jgi:hypothetical protein
MDLRRGIASDIPYPKQLSHGERAGRGVYAAMRCQDKVGSGLARRFPNCRTMKRHERRARELWQRPLKDSCAIFPSSPL